MSMFPAKREDDLITFSYSKTYEKKDRKYFNSVINFPIIK